MIETIGEMAIKGCNRVRKSLSIMLEILDLR